MKITAIATLILAWATQTGVANARILEPEVAFNPVTAFSDLMIRWVEFSERGPTISGHFMVHVQAALLDTYAAFEENISGAVTVWDDENYPIGKKGKKFPKKKFKLPKKKLAATQMYAMIDAAYEVITTLGQTLLNQKYLEIEIGENATERMTLLMDEALTLRDTVFDELQLKNSPLSVAKGVSSTVTSAILAKVKADGSNYENDYVDTSGYAIRPMFEPVPVITRPERTDYNFLDGSWVKKFNTYDAVLANSVENTGFAQVHPLVADGTLTLTDTYQSLTQHGIFPPDADGGEQFPLTAHWGSVTPFSIENSSVFRTEVFGPTNENGDLNDQWVEEAREVVELGFQQQDSNCPKCRAESEYWELGDEFAYPPGWWVERATEIAKNNNMNIKESLQIIFGTAITVFDAGVAAWEMKYTYDTVRPVTTINELFKGSNVSDWRGYRLANIDDKDHWRPYQLRRNIVPPFPDIPSGHSAFSTSASVVLRHLLGTNLFNYETEPFISRFDLTDGFDGNSANGNEETTLSYDTFSQAADAAGYSRLLGGIHMMQGNILGLEMGSRVGHSTMKYLRKLFDDDNIGVDPVNDVMNDIVFGTGRDDVSLVAHCGQDGPVEVYGFYGNDVLEFSESGICGPVSLFGGDGADTFRVGAKCTIQDYEIVDIIKLNMGEGSITTSVTNSVTTVSIDGDEVVDVDGVWTSDDLNIVFELFA